MALPRIVYTVALVFAIVFYILSPIWLAWFLLVLIVLFLPFDLLVSLPGMLTRRISFRAPQALEQGTKAEIVFETVASRRFPSGYIRLKLRQSSEEGSESRRVLCFGRVGSRRELEIDSTECGLVILTVQRQSVLSIMGLFSLSQKAGVRRSILVLPRAAIPPNVQMLPQSSSLRPKPGGGYSEEHDIRPYRQGDAKNSIHWKLTAKHDSLIVREALESPPHSRLVKCAAWSGPRERELVLSRLRWVSEYLLEHELAHFVSIAGEFAEVTADGDLVSFLRSALDGETQKKSLPLPHFTWIFSVDAREAL